jgi:hypothetical protein
MKTHFRGILAGAVFVTAGCQDLNVVNENLPDTQRALEEPSAVETVIKSAFGRWWVINTNGDTHPYYSVVASEMASTQILRQMQPSFEPRQSFKNDPVADEVWIPRGMWDAFNSGLANANDGLNRILLDKLAILTVDAGATAVTDNTARARIYGKVMAGLNLGYVGLTFDRGAVYTPGTVLPKGYDDLVAWEVNNLKPYKDVIAAAIAVLDDAIADIDASPAFIIPADPTWLNTTAPVTSATLRQFTNSLAARMLVYGARTPQERQQVDWNRVLQYTSNGLTTDFGVTLATGVYTNSHWTRIQSGGTTVSRAHYSVIGPADTSGAYQAWVAAPLEQRNRFNIATRDRRITGTTATSSGAYFRYRTDNNGFDASRGTYNFSAYQWFRGNGVNNAGFGPIIYAVENSLLRAEAMLRLGRNQEAADLINISRTRSVRIGTATHPGLPAVTAAGVPQSTGCAPRDPQTGACGTLLQALIYEREVELMGVDPLRTWMDRRGLGTLPKGTVLHMPIPARYLVSMGLPLYTFGGVGGEGAAQ